MNVLLHNLQCMENLVSTVRGFSVSRLVVIFNNGRPNGTSFFDNIIKSGAHLRSLQLAVY